ncbi:MAG: ABC transporter ATP-binding protein, partial [Planctomycetota bacterium]
MSAEPSWSDEELERAIAVVADPAGRTPFISIRGLHKRFGPRHILRGIDLDIYAGETVVILGLSGSGKSTLMKHLMGSHPIDEGSILVDGRDLATMDGDGWGAYRRDMGVVFQHAALLGSLSVEANVGLPLTEVDRLPPDEVRPRVIEALHRVFLPAEEILHLSPSDLSGGMQKRVGL